MTNKKKQQLNLEVVDSVHSKLGKQKEVKIPIEVEGEIQEAVLSIDMVFKPTKIRACVEEFVTKMDIISKRNNTMLEGVIEVFLIFMVIKHFSSFPAPDDYKDQVKVLQKLIDTEILYAIYSKFDPKEINKIHEEVKVASDRLEAGVEEFMEFVEQIGYKSELYDEE